MTGRHVVLLSISALFLFAYQNCSTPNAQESLSYGSKAPSYSSSGGSSGVFGSSNDPGTGYTSDGVLGCALNLLKPRYQATETVKITLSCNFNLADPARPYKARWFEKDANGAYFEVLNQDFWGVGGDASPAVWEMAAKNLSIGTHTRYVQLCDVNANLCNLKTAAVSFQVLPECGLSATYRTPEGASINIASGSSIPTGRTIFPYLQFKVWVNANADQLRTAGIVIKNMGNRMYYLGQQKPSGYYLPDATLVSSESVPYPGYNFSLGSSPVTPDQTFLLQAAIYDKNNNLICESYDFSLKIVK